MGFPYTEADWAVVDGAMYMGAFGSMPGIYTAISVLACIYLLWACNRVEKGKYDAADSDS